MTNTRKLTLVAVLSALSFLLMFYQLSIGIDFLKVDLATGNLDLSNRFEELSCGGFDSIGSQVGFEWSRS